MVGSFSSGDQQTESLAKWTAGDSWLMRKQVQSVSWSRFVITVKDDGTVKVRLVAKDLKCKRFVDTSELESYAGVHL